MKNNIFKSRRFKHGTLATVLTAVFIAAVVLVNVIATVLLNRFPLSIDLTKDQTFQLAEDSKDFLKNLDTPVKIHVLMDESVFTGNMYFGGFYDTQVHNVFKQLDQHSGKVTVDFIDLEKNPSFGKNADSTYKFGQALTAGNIVVESDLRYKIITSPDELVNTEFDYQTYSNNITSSKAESVLMGAILSVTDKNPVKVANLTGFREIGADGLVSLMEQNSYIFEDINILTQDIPEDADMLLIAAPTVDYTQKEIDKIEKFLSNGENYGKNLIYLASYQQGALPMLEGYLKNDWDIEIGEGIVMETDQANMFGGYYSTLQFISGKRFTEGLGDYSEDALYMPAAVPVTGLNDSPSDGTDGTTEAIIKSSITSVLSPVEISDDWDYTKEEQKSFSTATASKRARYKNGTDYVESNVVAFGSTDFFLEDALTHQAFVNGEYTVKVFNTLSGKETNTLDIVPKYQSSDQLGVTDNVINVIKWIFMIILPILVFAVGIIIWLRRKNR